MHVLLASGCRVPEDVAVVGFDDVPLAPYLRPSLSSVAVPAYELGVAATTRLLQHLAGRVIEETVWLATRVVPRESSPVQQPTTWPATGISDSSESF